MKQKYEVLSCGLDTHYLNIFGYVSKCSFKVKSLERLV